jgi:hypothetical protein
MVRLLDRRVLLLKGERLGVRAMNCFLLPNFVAPALLAATLSAADPGNLSPWMPRPADFSFLWWAEGPPDYLDRQGPPREQDVLCFATGRIGLALDTRFLRVEHLGRFENPLDCNTMLRDADAQLAKLPAARLALDLRRNGKTFACTGRRPPRQADAFLFPVRFIETGRVFQHVVIDELEFAAGDERLPGKGRLEIAVWPDRLTLTAELDAAAGGDGVLSVELAGRRAETALRDSRRVTLAMGTEPQGVKLQTAAPVTLRWDRELGCFRVRLPDEPWTNVKGTYYPQEHLDRLDRWPLTVRNQGAEEIYVPLVFVRQDHLQITGLTPMLCEPDGTPTGLAVQLSKNWHQRPDKPDLPYQGPWFHGCVFLRVPPRCERTFMFTVCYARWGGIPAASHAQLCLVGWGHNQFWDQAAIGSFGESICYEPGRVQRRCFIDDVRPLMTLPQPDAKPFGWADNAGGGDFLVWIDDRGRYQAMRRTRTDYRAHGPCLTDVVYAEESAGGEIAARMSVSIPRSDDYLRVFHRVRYDVRRPVRWQRLAFHQLGADYYNAIPARRVAVGDARGLREEWEPRRAAGVYDRQGLPLSGDQPWVSIHALDRAALEKGAAAASRGLIVRSWRAVLGGRPAPVAHLSLLATEWGKGNHRTAIEIAPPPGLDRLLPGDFVDAEFEWVVFPADPAACYAPNAPFREALARQADTWRLVQREAAGNRLQVEVERGKVLHNYPLAIAVDGQQAACTLSGGLGYLPVTFHGLAGHRGYELRLDGRPFSQAVHGNDFWQTDYDPATGNWQMTFNVPLDRPAGQPRRLTFQRAGAGQ